MSGRAPTVSSVPDGHTTRSTLPPLRSGESRFGLPRRRQRTDPVEQRLKELARQGSHLAGVANFCSFVMVLLFSLGSLVSLNADALRKLQMQWTHTRQLDIPSAVSVVVSTFLVVCMDMVMVYAAAVLRHLSARRADWREKREHYLHMYGAATIEAGTYAYMSFKYDQPVLWIVVMLILGRAIAAPLFSIYLSKARPIPVNAGDILYEVELAGGAGVIRDVIREANDPDRSLDEKMALYEQAAVLLPADRQRLRQIIAELRRQRGVAPAPLAPFAPAGAVRSSRIPEMAPDGSFDGLLEPAGILEALPDGLTGDSHDRDGDVAEAEAAETMEQLLPMPTARYNTRRIRERLEATR